MEVATVTPEPARFDLGIPPPGTTEIMGVEIFRVGTWNGESFTVRDLDAMVAAFDRIGFKPPVKLGHDFSTGTPAYGWVEAIRREGDVLKADFSAVPNEIADMIRQRRYDTVSAEIWFNFERDGETFNRALTGVALLGGEIPAVSNLKPLHKSLVWDVGPGARSFNTIRNTKETPAMADDPNKAALAELAELRTKVTTLTDQNGSLVKTLDDQSKVIAGFSGLQSQIEDLRKTAADARAAQRKAKIDAQVDKVVLPAFRPFVRAMYEVATADDNPRLVTFTVEGKDTQITAEAALDQFVDELNKPTIAALFSTVSGRSPTQRDLAASDGASVGVEVDKRTKEYRATNPTASYEQAQKAVLAADPVLKSRFASQTH